MPAGLIDLRCGEACELGAAEDAGWAAGACGALTGPEGSGCVPPWRASVQSPMRTASARGVRGGRGERCCINEVVQRLDAAASGEETRLAKGEPKRRAEDVPRWSPSETSTEAAMMGCARNAELARVRPRAREAPPAIAGRRA